MQLGASVLLLGVGAPQWFLCMSDDGALEDHDAPRIQLLAVLAFGVVMLLIENQIQRLNESRAKLGKSASMSPVPWSGDMDINGLFPRMLHVTPTGLWSF